MMPAFCSRDEDHIDCLRKWLSALGPVIAILALFIALRQLSVADDTAARTLRAYVLLDTGKIEDVRANSKPKVVVGARNFGKTPAFKVTHAVRVTIAPYPGPVPTFDVPNDLVLGQSTMAPDQTTNSFVELPSALKQEDFDALRNGKLALYVLGHIFYEDAYGKARRVSYRRMIGGNVGMGSGTLAFTPVTDETD
jgi:hypothetical protein